MSHTLTSPRTWLGLLAPLLLLIAALAPPAALAQNPDQVLSTKYFTIYYPKGEEQTAQWYAGFADEVNESVSELLGARPIEGIALTIYNSEREYQRANPIAGIHPGVLAHAIPDEKEVGVAVERLRQLAPELARDSFRHEMTHLIAGELSGQQLPIGFQEGIAQYNEMSTGRSQEVVAELKNAQSAGTRLLSWEELNDRREFRRQLDLAYPQSYSMMAFLAERYGMGAFSRFLERLRRGDEYRDALFIAYGHPIGDLEKQWSEFLPGFLSEGWKNNVLTAYDLAPGIALYEAGRFGEAREHFARSERLYRDLGREARAAEAADYRSRAEKGERAAGLAAQSRGALEAFDYAAARPAAMEAASLFESIGLEKQRDSAAETVSLAEQGIEAQTALRNAQGRARLFDFGGATLEARRAGAAFGALGDQARLDEANALLATLWGWQRTAALGVLGLGALAILIGVVATLIALRGRARRRPALYVREENASWL